LGYATKCSQDDNTWTEQYLIQLPELDGWSAQRLNRHRKGRLELLKKGFWDATLRFYTSERQSWLVIIKEHNRPFLLDMPEFISDFLAWKKAVMEVQGNACNKRVT
jgi:hypothetical protein